ncbi:MAG: sigma-70 family RNA polymerase sigma factor [Planctomycetaceae bacterium]|nr:sigma-70 family RNA polymerase sigma factor [Planctomycetaceae bacterium]
MDPSATNDFSLPDQTELLAALKARPEETFADFFQQAKQRLQRIANFRMDYRLRGRVAESDVIQETYVRAAQRLDRYLDNPEVPFFVWLRAELNQKLIEVHRQHIVAGKRDVRKEQKIHHAYTGQTSIALAAHLVGQMTSASELLERAEQIETLQKSLEEMNEIDREVIALRHFEELSNVETAEILGIESSAASKRYLRALKRMREIFEKHQSH